MILGDVAGIVKQGHTVIAVLFLRLLDTWDAIVCYT